MLEMSRGVVVGWGMLVSFKMAGVRRLFPTRLQIQLATQSTLGLE